MSKGIVLTTALVLLAYVHAVAGAEEMTITTYYPSPYGVYNQMRAKRMAVGDSYYDSSQYCWPPASQIEGSEFKANNAS